MFPFVFFFGGRSNHHKKTARYVPNVPKIIIQTKKKFEESENSCAKRVPQNKMEICVPTLPHWQVSPEGINGVTHPVTPRF